MVGKTRTERKKESTIPNRWTPKFWDEVDGRLSLKREIQRRVNEMIEDTGADSVQKRMLAEIAVFIGLQLETMKTEVVKSGRLDVGVFIQSANALSGILVRLGLDKKQTKTIDLKAYVNKGNRTA